MSTRDGGIDEAVRALLLLTPRVVGRAKRLQVPDELRPLPLAPRHLTLLAHLLYDGPTSVGDLAARLEVAPATVSLMVGDLSRHGVLERTEDATDRRRRIVGISPERRPAVDAWLGRSAAAWRAALEPLTGEQRELFVDTFAAYERALGDEDG